MKLYPVMPKSETPNPSPLPKQRVVPGHPFRIRTKPFPQNADGSRQIIGTVVSVTAESVFLDIGYKTEGILPMTLSSQRESPVKPGDKFPVTVKGRDPEGYYELSRSRERRPTDWTAFEKAFADKAIIAGTVSAVIKGGLSVDVGVAGFLPASRSGTRDAAEMEKLVGSRDSLPHHQARRDRGRCRS